MELLLFRPLCLPNINPKQTSDGNTGLAECVSYQIWKSYGEFWFSSFLRLEVTLEKD
jgi:hypothetical protein